MTVRSFEHAGVIVHDLEAVASFFELLGFRRTETMSVGGEWADRVNGLTGTQVEMAFVTAPDGSGALELTRFVEPGARRTRPSLTPTLRGCAILPTASMISGNS